MLVLKAKTTRAQDGSQLYIEVVNATGVYDSVNNPGGFGSPNPARNTLALVFYGNFKRVAADVLAVPLPYDATTVSSYTLSLPGVNGVMDGYVFAIPIFDPMGSYVDGNIVYDNQDNSNPIIKKMVSSAWVPIEVTDLIGESTIVQKEVIAFAIPEMEAYRNQLSIVRTEELQKAVANNQDDWEAYHLARKNFDYVDGTLDAAGMAFCSAAYAEAQLNIETLEAFAVENPVTP